MKPIFIVQETQDGGYAVFRSNALNGSFDQYAPETGSVSKEDAEKMCEECNYLAEEETPGIISKNKPDDDRPAVIRILSIFTILAILIIAPTIHFLKKSGSFDNATEKSAVDEEVVDDNQRINNLIIGHTFSYQEQTDNITALRHTYEFLSNGQGVSYFYQISPYGNKLIRKEPIKWGIVLDSIKIIDSDSHGYIFDFIEGTFSYYIVESSSGNKYVMD